MIAVLLVLSLLGRPHETRVFPDPADEYCVVDRSGLHLFRGIDYQRLRVPLDGLTLLPVRSRLGPNLRAVLRTVRDRHGRQMSTWVYSDQTPLRMPFRVVSCR